MNKKKPTTAKQDHDALMKYLLAGGTHQEFIGGKPLSSRELLRRRIRRVVPEALLPV